MNKQLKEYHDIILNKRRGAHPPMIQLLNTILKFRKYLADF